MYNVFMWLYFSVLSEGDVEKGVKLFCNLLQCAWCWTDVSQSYEVTHTNVSHIRWYGEILVLILDQNTICDRTFPDPLLSVPVQTGKAHCEPTCYLQLLLFLPSISDSTMSWTTIIIELLSCWYSTSVRDWHYWVTLICYYTLHNMLILNIVL